MSTFEQLLDLYAEFKFAAKVADKELQDQGDQTTAELPGHDELPILLIRGKGTRRIRIVGVVLELEQE